LRLHLVGVVDLQNDLEQRHHPCHLLHLVPLLLPRKGDQLDVVVSQLVAADLLWFFKGDLAGEDQPIGEEDEGWAFDLASHPLGHAEEEVFIDEDAYSVGQVVFGVALVPAIPEINDRVHIINN